MTMNGFSEPEYVRKMDLACRVATANAGYGGGGAFLIEGPRRDAAVEQEIEPIPSWLVLKFPWQAW
jgi:hypothetical protein